MELNRVPTSNSSIEMDANETQSSSTLLMNLPVVGPTATTGDEEMMEMVIQLNTVAYVYLMPLFISVGIFTNIVNMYVLHDLGKVKDRKHKGSPTTYMYLNWLSFAQLLASISVIPSLMNLYREALSFTWAMYFAHFEICVINSLTSSCVYIVVGLSVDRFVAVCKPHSYQVLSRVRLATIRIIASFIIPPLMYTPLCFFQKVVPNEAGDGYTTIDNKVVTEKPFWQFWNVAVELCHRLIPAIFIVILNLCIIVQFRKMRNSYFRSSRKSLRPEESSIDGKSQVSARNSANKQPTTHEQDSKMFVLLLGVIIVFLITTLPSACLGLTDTFGHKYYSLEFEVFRAIANLLEILGFAMNFFLYFFLVPEVRAKLLSLLPKK